MNMKHRNIPFSPPDMTEAEAKELREAILSGWITTGPRTKKLEQQIEEFINSGSRFKVQEDRGDGFSDLKVQSVAVQSCFTNNRSQQ